MKPVTGEPKTLFTNFKPVTGKKVDRICNCKNIKPNNIKIIKVDKFPRAKKAELNPPHDEELKLVSKIQNDIERCLRIEL